MHKMMRYDEFVCKTVPVQSGGCGEMVSLPPALLRQQLAQAAKQAALQPGFGYSMVYR